jgi:hypothetical protein
MEGLNLKIGQLTNAFQCVLLFRVYMLKTQLAAAFHFVIQDGMDLTQQEFVHKIALLHIIRTYQQDFVN